MCQYGYKINGGCKKKPGPKATGKPKKTVAACVSACRKTSRKRSRKTSRKRSRKTSPKVRSSQHRVAAKKCKAYLAEKIKDNIRNGYPRQQAIAIAYSQTKKRYKACDKYM